ncbi:MAG: hypothetical protein ACK5NK_04515 [Niabella sp.]
MNERLTISNTPENTGSQDYFYLRRLGMQYIEDLGSKFWTDYNIHDPGITLLEALCYAITDLGYRTSYSITDLISQPTNAAFKPDKQALFTPRKILTVNPWTVNDYRKMLIDINGIKNGWLFIKNCPCEDIYLYVDCKNEKLSYKPFKPTATPVIVKGLYDVMVEFEDVEALGDLNTGKLYSNISFHSKDPLQLKTFNGSIEVRFPSWQQVETQFAKFRPLLAYTVGLTEVIVNSISGNKSDATDIDDTLLYQEISEPLYAGLTIKFLVDKNDASTNAELELNNIPLRVILKGTEAKSNIAVQDIRKLLEDNGEAGLINSFITKLQTAHQIIKATKKKLHSSRNLAEDWCAVTAISIEEIGICADVDVTPDADIEQVLATVYFLIGRYFSPEIGFHSLQELLEAGVAVDDIFDGPALDNGFINNDELEAASVKKELYASDVINIMMDIPGIVAVRNLTLVGYDAEGNKTNAESWVYRVANQHQPRLYIHGSKLLAFKNGLPFLPDNDELDDSMQLLQGLNAQPVYDGHILDLPVKNGSHKNITAYYPVQYQLPQTYGVSEAGLNPMATPLRKAQAIQLSGYMLLFEQLLVNYLAQLRNIDKLFSLDDTVQQTYFSFLLKETELSNMPELKAVDLNENVLQELIEDEDTMLDRRNRFLDHLLARFSESFSDYALMLFSLSQNKKLSEAQLIKDKIRFLEDYPGMSHDRALSFNYKKPEAVCSAMNVAGLSNRIEKLLSLKQAGDYFELYEEKDEDSKLYETRWRLKNDAGKIILSSSTKYPDADLKESINLSKQEIDNVLQHILTESDYTIEKDKKWTLNLTNGSGEVIATRKQAFDTKAAVITARDELIAFAKEKVMAAKIYIVEHLLLRSRNKPSAQFPNGDPLLGICPSKNCEPCVDDDPYSFRITIVLSGESGLTENHIEFRRFAEKTIRQEVPAHLGIKICWVSTQQMFDFNEVYCKWLAELSKESPDTAALHDKLQNLLNVFNHLKTVYPDAYLHDCADGNDDNRLFLNQTIV